MADVNQHEFEGGRHATHFAAGLGGALLFLAPFWHGWKLTVGTKPFPLRFWPGNLVIDGLEFLLLVLAGATAGGWWWWAAAWRRGSLAQAGACGLLASGMVSMVGWLSPRMWLLIVLAWAGWGIVAANAGHRRRERLPDFLRQRVPWNLPFFVLLVILGTWSDAVLIHRAPAGWLPTVSFVASRFLTQLALASCAWFLVLLLGRWAPRGTGFFAWTAVAVVPVFVVADILLRLLWTKGLVQLCGELEVGGRIDWTKVLAGGGVELSAGRIAGIAAGLLCGPLLFLIFSRISRRRAWHAPRSGFLMLGFGCWIGLLALQMANSAWMPPAWRCWAWRSCYLHLSPGVETAGLVAFDVEMADPIAAGEVKPERHPDIFLFVVETLRADAIRPDVAPFLARWKDQECQPIAECRAAANATHLSWFSILHGRLALYWERARMKSGTAPLLSLLHQAGYRIESRAAGSFDYYDMFRMNFSGGEVAVFDHVPADSPAAAIATPEREVALMQRLRQSVAHSTAGGTLYLTALDATHYDYKWHRDWKPPFADYEANPFFPLSPTPEELARIQRRYWNSVAWIDHLMAEFVAVLKAAGRYDDALILLTGDHGEEFKEHGSWFHCSALNQPQTRVPILVKWPLKQGRGEALADASHLDVMPTLLEFAGCQEQILRMLPGRPLQRHSGATSILTTNLVSQNGEAMVWRRNGWEAAFSWSSPWVLGPPRRLWLERLESPGGLVTGDSSADVEAELRRQFPDAFDRIFVRCRRTSP